jgi:glutaredoxin/glutathione-dependent peroxiredoxin
MEKLNCKGLYHINEKGIIAPYEVGNENTIICGIPGAYTHDCTNNHLPGFVANLDKLKQHTITKVVFIGVNDSFVMKAWNDQYGHPDIDSVSDPLATFAKYLKKDVDWGESFGVRSHRYAFLIQNGNITHEFKIPFIEGVLQEL